MRTRKTQNSLRIIDLFYHCGYLVIERLSSVNRAHSAFGSESRPPHFFFMNA